MRSDELSTHQRIEHGEGEAAASITEKKFDTRGPRRGNGIYGPPA